MVAKDAIQPSYTNMNNCGVRVVIGGPGRAGVPGERGTTQLWVVWIWARKGGVRCAHHCTYLRYGVRSTFILVRVYLPYVPPARSSRCAERRDEMDAPGCHEAGRQSRQSIRMVHWKHWSSGSGKP